MERTERQRRLGWLLPLRLASYIILMMVVLWMGYPGYLHLQIILYSILTLALVVTLSLERRYRLNTVVHLILALQFMLEVGIESGIIYATGNINSSFSALYLLTIVSAALAYRLVGTLLMASLVSTAYAFILWLGFAAGNDQEFSLQALRTVFSTNDSLFYSIFIHILIFYLVAFISGYLAERLSSQGKQLADASRELRRAKLETDDILTHLNSGLLTIDPHGHIIYFNRAAERILEYTEEQVRGMLCTDAFAERMPQLSGCLIDALKQKHMYPRAEIEIKLKNGGRRPVGLSTSILTEESGSIRGVIAIFSDLTDAKALEAKVRAADRLAAVGELSASIAHEIRNPLASISGSVEVLRDELTVGGDNLRLMNLIVKESDRLTHILTDFLTFARINPPALTKVELCHVVGDVLELVRHHDSYREDVRTELQTDESFVYVLADENLLKQMLLNLVLNAHEAFGEDGGYVVVHIRTDHESGRANLFVRDNGPGMEEAVRERVFEPFYSTKKSGTGLGLSIVHRIATALKANLTVESNPGEGTAFLMQFRMHGSHQTEDPSPEDTVRILTPARQV